MEWCNTLAISFCQLFYYLTEACIVIVHISYKENTRNFMSLTKLPCFSCSNFDTLLCRNYNNCCITCTNCFFYFTNKIEITRSVKEINLCIFPNHRNYRSTNREHTLNFFTVKIANCITFFYLTLTSN